MISEKTKAIISRKTLGNNGIITVMDTAPLCIEWITWPNSDCKM